MELQLIILSTLLEKNLISSDEYKQLLTIIQDN